jgi:hypothetical protein
MPLRLHVADRKLAGDWLTIFFALVEQNITTAEHCQSEVGKN